MCGKLHFRGLALFLLFLSYHSQHNMNSQLQISFKITPCRDLSRTLNPSKGYVVCGKHGAFFHSIKPQTTWKQNNR